MSLWIGLACVAAFVAFPLLVVRLASGPKDPKRQYRIVTNDLKFRLQVRWKGFLFWGEWTYLPSNPFAPQPYWTFDSLHDASAKLQEIDEADRIAALPWRQVGA